MDPETRGELDQTMAAIAKQTGATLHAYPRPGRAVRQVVLRDTRDDRGTRFDAAQIEDHAPNAKGNFCFEVTLGYRRVERGHQRRGAAGPLGCDPGGFVPQAERFALLAGVLDGVELGAWDRQVAG